MNCKFIFKIFKNTLKYHKQVIDYLSNKNMTYDDTLFMRYQLIQVFSLFFFNRSFLYTTDFLNPPNTNLHGISIQWKRVIAGYLKKNIYHPKI